MATKCDNSTSSNSHSRSTERHLKELVKKATKNGWGPRVRCDAPPQCSENTNSPMSRQRSISELPVGDWNNAEVYGATVGYDEYNKPSYRNEIENIMIIEDPEIRKKGLTEDELWRIAGHVARARRYEGEGRLIRHEDKIVLERLRKLGIIGGKRKTKRKKTRKYRKTRKSRKAKKSRKTRKSRKAKKSRKTRKSRRSNRRKTHKNNKKHKKK